MSKTLLEAVRASLAHAVRFNARDVVAPTAGDWTTTAASITLSRK
jgi:hypothetical protein